MKNLLIVLLALTTAGLGAGWWQQTRQTKSLALQLAALQQLTEQHQAELAQAEAVAASLRDKLYNAQTESAVNAGQAAQLSKVLTNRLEDFVASQPQPTNNKTANPLAEMLKSPEMRDMIRKQQEAVLGTLVDRNYSALFKSLNLSSEQQAAMKELLLNRMTGDTETAMNLMSGEMTAEQRAEATRHAKEYKDALTQQLKDLLGADYPQFEAYEKTVPDRMAVSQLTAQLGGDLALNPSQEEALINAMSKERQNFKFTMDFSNQNEIPDDFSARFTEENINRYLEEQQKLNQQYLNSAQGILSANQLAAYQKALTTQMEMAKVGMKMATSMFGTQKK